MQAAGLSSHMQYRRRCWASCILFLLPPLIGYAADPAESSPEKRLESLRSLNITSLSPQQAFDVSVMGLDLADDLISRKHFADASSAAMIAKTAAKKADNTYLIKSGMYYSKYALSLDAEYQKVGKAVQTLKTNPASKADSEAAGLFYCFNSGDWQKGLPLLLNSADDSLVNLAKRVQQFPAIPVDQIQLGDLWAEYAENGDPKLKAELLQRAKYWYLKALPGLPALERAQLVKRINRIPKKTFQLNIAVRIDGSDTLTLSQDRLLWRNHSYQYPSILMMNGIRWETKQITELANQGGTRVLPHRIHLATARLTKQEGRGPVTLKVNQDDIAITFDDSKPGGHDDYVIQLTFDTY